MKVDDQSGMGSLAAGKKSRRGFLRAAGIVLVSTIILYMFKLLRRIGTQESVLPCKNTGGCPYEYDKDPDRDIEGMPFPADDDDPMECPVYGHICPEFMENFGLTTDDLNIRAIIHCGTQIEYLVESGEVDKDSDEYKILKQELHEIVKKYPIDKFPEYYAPILEESKIKKL